MSKWQLPSQKGTELWPSATRIPARIALFGVDSSEAERVWAAARSQVHQFFLAQSQQYQLSNLRQHRARRSFPGVQATYTNSGGQETMTIHVRAGEVKPQPQLQPKKPLVSGRLVIEAYAAPMWGPGASLGDLIACVVGRTDVYANMSAGGFDGYYGIDNIPSVAVAHWLYQAAGQPNPADLPDNVVWRATSVPGSGVQWPTGLVLDTGRTFDASKYLYTAGLNSGVQMPSSTLVNLDVLGELRVTLPVFAMVIPNTGTTNPPVELRLRVRRYAGGEWGVVRTNVILGDLGSGATFTDTRGCLWVNKQNYPDTPKAFLDVPGPLVTNSYLGASEAPHVGFITYDCLADVASFTPANTLPAMATQI